MRQDISQNVYSTKFTVQLRQNFTESKILYMNSSIGEVVPDQMVLMASDWQYGFKVEVDCSKVESYHTNVKVQVKFEKER